MTTELHTRNADAEPPRRGESVLRDRERLLIVGVEPGRLTVQDDEGLAVTLLTKDVYWDPLTKTWRR